MNKEALLQLNMLPEGKAAWLSYDNYLTLKTLFEAVPLPSDEETIPAGSYLDLHRFLTQVARLPLPLDEKTIHFNAFALIRRGYKIEAITEKEYEQLRHLMNGLEEPSPDDLDLYESGGHRALYDYLTKEMGLSVKPGRGPVWHRAKALIERYETKEAV